MDNTEERLKRAMYNVNSFQLCRMTSVDLHLTYTSELFKTLRLLSEMGRHSHRGQQISAVDRVKNPNAALSFAFF